MTKHFTPSRRDLLKGGGALIVSFSLWRATALAEQAAAQRPLSIAEVDAFLAIDARGRVTVYSGKVDLGTGVRTALAQMAAEELDVPFNAVRVVEGDTALTPDQGTTWGSLTIQAGGMQIRNAAATARAALIEQAAKRLDAKPEELSVANGVIRAGNRRVSLWRADRRQDVRDQARPRQAGEVQGSEGLQDRRQVDPARRHPGEGDGALPLHQQSARTRHAAWPRDPPAVGRCEARKRRRRLDQGRRRYRAGRARGQFPRRGGAERVGRDQGCAPAQGELVEMGGAAGAGEALRARARQQGVPRRDHRQCRQHRRGDGQGGA